MPNWNKKSCYSTNQTTIRRKRKKAKKLKQQNEEQTTVLNNEIKDKEEFIDKIKHK